MFKRCLLFNERKREREGRERKRVSLKVKFSLQMERVVGGIKEANTRVPT